jgi:antitoxin component YwqK of YwqJK toxin-antitoxin module
MTARRLKKKVLPKDEYDGTKTERRVGSYGTGGRATIEEFNVVKYIEDEAVSQYVQEVWWFDPAQSRIVNTTLKENQRAQICHGPYKKIVNQLIVEEGYFHMGAKDGRWETYDAEGLLLSKNYFDRGFPTGSAISYFDAEKKKIKEVIPFVYGKVTGQYLLFYASGNVAMEGKLDDNVRVGRWREFYEFGTGGRLKKEIRYGKDKFEVIEPILVQERDEKGKITSQTKLKFD